jgi:uncharacterized protein (TIGR00255 family)
MSLASMTGFARASGMRAAMNWQWELKTVNGKALDVRFRLPPGFEHLEAPARAALTQALRRGNVQAALTLSGAVTAARVVVNEEVLNQLAALAGSLREKLGGEPVRADALLSLRGVVDVVAAEPDEEERAAASAAILVTLNEAIAALAAHRREEGGRLKTVIEGQLQRIAELAASARANPARTPEAIRQRLAEMVAKLMETGASFEAARLHQEAVLLFTRADIQEELDRLDAHVEAARQLISSEEPAGRKFDFLAQEFNREANTLCSKSNDRALTATGLELKTVIDQMREQVQNIE